MIVLHAIWALLNLAFLVGVFVVSYRSYRSSRGRFGYLPGGLLFFILVGIGNGSRNKVPEPSTRFSYTKNIYSTGTWSYNREFVVYGGDVFRITQSIRIDPLQHTDSLRVQSFITDSGLTLGTRWQSVQTVAGLLPGRRAFYQSTGTLTWCLLGIPLYVQLKQFGGEVPR